MRCTNCNEIVDHEVDICPNCGAILEESKQTVKSNSSYSPFLMGVASFFIPGLGQMIMGQVKKGLTLLIISIFLGIVTFGFAGFILMIVATVDAVKIAKKLKQGRSVEAWEFF